MLEFVSSYCPDFIICAISIALSSSWRDIVSKLSKCTESYATNRGLLSINTPPSYVSAHIRVIGAAPVFLVVLNTIMSLFNALDAATIHMSPRSVSYTLSLFMFIQSASVVCSGMHGSF